MALVTSDLISEQLPPELMKALSTALTRYEKYSQQNATLKGYVDGAIANKLVSPHLQKQFTSAIKNMGMNMAPVVISSFADRVPPIQGDYFPRVRSKIDALKAGIITYSFMTVSVDHEGYLQIYKPGEVYTEYARDEITPTLSVFVKKKPNEGIATLDEYTVLFRDGSTSLLCHVSTANGVKPENLTVHIEEVGADYELKVIDAGANGIGGIDFAAPILEPVAPLQDALDYSFIALVAGTETYTNPLKQRTNFQPNPVQLPDGTWKLEPIKIDPRQNNIIGVEGEGEIKQLQAIDPTALNNLRKSWGEAIATVTGLPPYEIIGSGVSDNTSGTALRLLSMKRDLRSRMIGQAIADALDVLAGSSDDGELFTVGTLDDQTFSEKLADAQIMQTLALPQRVILEHLGYSNEKIKELLNEIEDRQADATSHSMIGSGSVLRMLEG